MQIAVLGIDLGKNSCSVAGMDVIRTPADQLG
jgi:molecular chaperone DnaK (HSP70)